MVARASASSAARALELASAQLSRSEFGTAERTLQRLLKWQPGSGEAWNLLSIIANATGRSAEALQASVSALALDATRAEFHFSHGRALKSAQRLDEAINAYEEALRIRPNYAEVLVSLGIALRLRGRLGEATERYRQALRLRPDFPEALGNLGNALAERIGRDVGERVTSEDLREAEEVQRRALALSPRDPNLLHNLGLVLKLTGRYDESADLLNRALGIDSGRVDTCLQFGDLLFQETRFDLARQLYLRWLEDHPPHPDIMLGLAKSLAELGETDEAMAWLERVLRIDPNRPDAHHLRGRILQQRFRADADARDALNTFRSAIEARPDYFEAVCSYLLTLCYVESDPVALLAAHRERLLPVFGSRQRQAWPVLPRTERRLRIGYVSHDFKRHSVAYFLEGILEAHDRLRFEIHAYKGNAGGDTVTARLKPLCDRWVECGHLSDALLADRIRADGIDVLVDLAGLTSGSRLGVFQHRAAPCQITYLGYPASTGSTFFDARISDAVIDPQGEEVHSSEPLLRCAPTMFCYRPGDAPEVGSLPAASRGIVTFGSFNNFAKVGEHTLRLWCAVLRSVPHSRLHLKAAAFLQRSNREFVRQYFAEQGIAPDRLVVQTWADKVEAHLDCYNDIDIALDTVPFNGATTTCEALYMGVPVVTLVGRTQPSRMGASILGALSLTSLVANDDTQFVEIASGLARDLTSLASLRGGLRERMRHSRLLDKVGFTRGFESLLVSAHERVVAVAERELSP